MNHFPFVLRNMLMLPFLPATDRRRHIKVSGAAMGYPGARVIVQDLSVEQVLGYPNAVLWNALPTGAAPSGNNGGVLQLLMRIGWKGKGYLTEELLPYGTFLNKAKPLTPTWNFVKPYRMDPGEALTATVWPTANMVGAGRGINTQGDYSVNFGKCVGVMFHGTRIKDGNPIMLYDATQALEINEDKTAPVFAKHPLTAKTLACPADTSILLHSVSTSTFNNGNYYGGAMTFGHFGLTGSMLQIYGPGGQEWMRPIFNSYFPYVLPPGWDVSVQEYLSYCRWVDIKGSLVELGEQRGWLKEPREEVTVELEFPDGAQSQLARAMEGSVTEWPFAVTIRGSLEVPNA